MSGRTIGYAISHTGKPGGPWEDELGEPGTATVDPSKRLRGTDLEDMRGLLKALREYHPCAKVVRLVSGTKSKDRIAHLEWAIRTGGAALRAERACLGVPGGIDPSMELERKVLDAARDHVIAIELGQGAAPDLQKQRVDAVAGSFKALQAATTALLKVEIEVETARLAALRAQSKAGKP